MRLRATPALPRSLQGATLPLELRKMRAHAAAGGRSQTGIEIWVHLRDDVGHGLGPRAQRRDDLLGAFGSVRGELVDARDGVVDDVAMPRIQHPWTELAQQ